MIKKKSFNVITTKEIDYLIENISIILKHYYDVEKANCMLDAVLNRQCFKNIIELYIDKNGKLIGFNSYRLFKIDMNNDFSYISRGASFILPEFRRKKTTIIFFAKNCFFSVLFNKNHFGFFIASGVGNFYSTYKFCLDKFIYPSLKNDRNDYYHRIAQNFSLHFGYKITNHDHPLKVFDPYALAERNIIENELGNKTFHEKSILNYYNKHTTDKNSSLVVLVDINYKLILSYIFKLSYEKFMIFFHMINKKR